MLYINGKKADRVQNVIHAIYHECRILRETILEYNKCIDFNSNYLNNLIDDYPELLSASLESMRYRIMIGMGVLFDENKKSLSINKMINLCEQVGKKELNKEVKNAKIELLKFNDLKNNIKQLRDKMYAHIEIEYSLEEEDIFDLDFDFLNQQLVLSLDLLDYVMNLCEVFSEKYDNDILKLKISNRFNK